MSMLQMLAGLMGGGLDAGDLNKSLGDAAAEWREYRQDVKAIRASLDRIVANLPAAQGGPAEPAAVAATGDVAR